MSRRYIPTLQQEMDDPFNEWNTWDYVDDECPEDHPDWFENREEWIKERDEWWKQQDDEMQELEMAEIELQAEMQELRHNGYWD